MEEPSFMNVDSDSPSSVLKMLTVSRCNGIRGMRGVLTGRDVDRRKCATCGRMEESVRSYAGSTCVVKERRYYPFHDYLTELGEPVWSERVVECMTRNGLLGFRAHQIPIQEQGTLKILKEGIPDYYVIEITAKVMIDLDLYDGGDGLLCPECRYWDPRPGGTVSWGDKIKAIIDRGEEPTDFALCSSPRIGTMFCSPRFVELVRANGFTGFEFGSGCHIALELDRADWWERYCAEAKRRYPFNCANRKPPLEK